jgi:hypothetical protein
MAKEQVTLIATDTVTPYFKGDVFTVDKDTADALLDKRHARHPKDEDGNPLPVKVERYDEGNKKHKEALDTQRGKTEDVEVENARINTNPAATQELQNNPAGPEAKGGK